MDNQENEIYIAVLIACTIIGIIIIYFIRSMIQQHRKNFELQKKNIVAEVNALEKERSRMATDLHDELGPVLAGIKLKLNSIDISEEDQELIESTSENIDRVLKRMREISFNLMPQALLRNGIVAAINQLVSFYTTDKLHVFLEAESSISMPEEKAIHVYRIIQEIFHNTAKHARASELKISLRQNNGTLLLESDDNGIGFTTRQPEKFAGIGLRSMLSRAELVGGKMYLDAAPNKGTHLRFEIPNENLCTQ